jgi:hypothetical protein
MTSLPAEGRAIVRLNVALSTAFVATAVYSAAVFDTVAQWIGAVTAMALFAVGVAAFIWSFWTAVQRSRADDISITQLYLLAGAPTPAPVRKAMVAALGVQVVTATATALARPNGPDGTPGSSLAVGFLVPMLGLGMNGLWAALHGTFGERQLAQD